LNLSRIASVVRCSHRQCRAPLATTPGGFVCTASATHVVAQQDGIHIFAEPDVGKYEPEYASRYAALWAFGYQTLHKGLDEGLYRTVSSFVAEALVQQPGREVLIVDAGCGVGRVLADCAALAPQGVVVAFDASPAMLEFARRAVVGNEIIEVSLPTFGFPPLHIGGAGARNVFLGRADVEDLPLVDGRADLVLSVNIVDRLPHGPEIAFRECHRILRPGGTLVFTDPFNWIEPWLWEKYPDAGAVLALLESIGFTVETWFDDLFYREILDVRGSYEDFKTMTVKATKQ
jgi:SAM-dependent methyltransferase